MANDSITVQSIGFLEGWIEKAADHANKDLTVSNAESALNHLQIVEASFHEYRRLIETYRSLLQDLKRRVDLGVQL